MHRRAGVLAPAGAALAVCLVAVPAASAKTFVPNRFGDHPANGCTRGDCTLREALDAANARAGTDAIDLRGGRTYRLSAPGAAEDSNASGDLDVLDPLIVETPSGKRAVIDGGRIDRVLDTHFTVGTDSLVLGRVVIRGGDAGASIGGGVLARGGSLNVLDSVVTANRTAGNYGGGIGVFGGAYGQIQASTLSGNKGDGGGLAVGPASHADLLSSTVSRNKGGNGGGVFVSLGGGASLTAVNATISGNEAVGSGGGIAAATDGAVLLKNVTIARNRANTGGFVQYGGGVANLSTGPLEVRNSVIALNSVNGGSGPDCYGLGFTSAGRNLISDPAGCSSLAAGPNIVSKRPKLGSLARNGGPTKTVALLRGSPATNRAAGKAPRRDQRGYRRDSRPDIGAFERDAKRPRSGR